MITTETRRPKASHLFPILKMLRTLTVVAPLVFGLVYGQFDFFGNMFGQQQQQQQQQHPSGASQWAAHVESGRYKKPRAFRNYLMVYLVPCSEYLCPTTLVCVAGPMECSCPDVQDIKCLIPDADGNEATVICVRGQNECANVERLMRGRT